MLRRDLVHQNSFLFRALLGVHRRVEFGGTARENLHVPFLGDELLVVVLDRLLFVLLISLDLYKCFNEQTLIHSMFRKYCYKINIIFIL